jgi:membrane-bound lytic murein transglycosylase D
MRVPTRRLLASVVLTFAMTGCGSQQFVTQLWPWKQDPAGGATDLAQPFPELPRAAAPTAQQESPPEFDFDHHEVERYVSRYQSDLRGFYGRGLERSGRFVPFMQSILAQQGVPTELAYLPLIESGFQTGAVSRAGAVGPWQFMRATGRRYGLRIDRDVDERRDPIKSTEAAGRYLRDLYDMFNDWHLSLAAYNTGEGNIARILETRGWQDYWAMGRRGYLVRETREYVPRFLAALQIARSPEAYGFERPDAELLTFDWVRVSRPISLATVAQLCGTSTSHIRDLNPALTRGVVPYNGYTLRIPKGMKKSFMAAAANLPAPQTYAAKTRGSARCNGRQPDGTHCLRSGETVGAVAKRYGISTQALLKANNIRDPRRLSVGQALVIPGLAPEEETEAVSVARTAPRTAPLTYRIRSGETLGMVASRHGMSAAALARYNGIRNVNRVRVGQAIQIPGRGQAKGTTRLAARPAAVEPRVATKEVERSAYTVPSVTDPPRRSAQRSHKVRSGESAFVIAQRHGVSLDALLRANGLRKTAKLKVGQNLVIPAGKAAPARAASADRREQPMKLTGATHTVRAGDTVYSIAKRYRVSVQSLCSANSLGNGRNIRVGQKLRLPKQVASK